MYYFFAKKVVWHITKEGADAPGNLGADLGIDTVGSPAIGEEVINQINPITQAASPEGTVGLAARPSSFQATAAGVAELPAGGRREECKSNQDRVRDFRRSTSSVLGPELAVTMTVSVVEALGAAGPEDA